MPGRTNPAKVKEILIDHYDLSGNPSLQAFIDSAASLVTYVQSKDTGGILSSPTLELIERWLAAHFYAHADQLHSQKVTGRATATFQGKTGMVLNSTQYGQTAMLLDVTGTLAALNKEAETGKRLAVGMIWLGTDYATRIYSE